MPAFKELKVIPDSELAPQQLSHLAVLRAVAVDFRLVSIRGAYIVPVDETRRIAGLYKVGAGEVFVSQDQLGRLKSTIDTGVHEIGHHVSGAEDGTREHNEAMVGVAEKVEQVVNSGRLDKLLVNAAW